MKSKLWWLMSIFVVTLLFLPLISPSQESPQAEKTFLEFSFPLKEAASFSLEGRPLPQLALGGQQIFLISQSGKILSFYLHEKKMAWTFDLAAEPQTSLVVANELIFIGDKQNKLSALSREGKLLWQKSFDHPFRGQIASWREKLILALNNNQIIALKAVTGEKIWMANLDEPVGTPFLIANSGLLAIGSEGKIYLLSSEGQVSILASIGKKVLPYACYLNDYLFLGTEDKHLLCWNLKKKKLAWSMKLAGKLAANPRPIKKNLYIMASNAVIYCLNQKSGEIQWWRSVSSRLAFDLLPAGEMILATTTNPPLLAFDLKTGQEVGRFMVEGEIASAPYFAFGMIAFLSYDTFSDQGYLHLLEPDIRLSLSSSLPSPQKAGTEIIFMAEAIGFVQPKFEFFLEIKGQRQIVQKESSKASWTWLALEPGDYIVGVQASDQKKSREATLAFQIVKEIP